MTSPLFDVMFLLCVIYADAYAQFSEYSDAQKDRYVQQFVLRGNNLTLIEDVAN